MSEQKDPIVEHYLKTAKEQAHLFQSCERIMASDEGESLVALINALTSGFKDTALYSEEPNERLVMRGAVIGLNTLLSQVTEFSQRSKDIGEEDVKVKDMVPRYATLGEDEEL